MMLIGIFDSLETEWNYSFRFSTMRFFYFQYHNFNLVVWGLIYIFHFYLHHNGIFVSFKIPIYAGWY